ncbi:MAG: DUF1592 domain-containing protein [Deltaproteobacteria bacterium]|nr:DUF1592 domain-containing protein [Deltaproteobacteria bacterium]
MIGGCYSGLEPGSGGDGIQLPGADEPGQDGEVAEVQPPERVQLRRLTRANFLASLEDLLGPRVELPSALEPDLVVELFANVGASESVFSELGTEQLEAAARAVAEQVVDDPAWRAELVGCEPSGAECLEDFIPRFGRAVFRRALTAPELARYQTLAQDIIEVRGDPWEAVEGVVTALLASPHFVYVVELGEPDPEDDERLRFTSVEMASRLSLALWGSGPDEELLAVAEAGQLVDPEVIAAQAERMLADPRARRGMGRFFAEWLGLDVLEGTTKDAALFPMADAQLFASMRGQVERMVEDTVFNGGSLRDLIAGRETFIDARLAELYGVPVPDAVDADGFGAVTLPHDGDRRGILGTGAFLASQSRRTRTSPTLRGLWVQTRLRCNELPPPPPDVETDLPDGTDDANKTLREILEEHRSNPVCAGCHSLMDPIGLALENFDAVGAWRDADRDHAIDASVDLEGVALDGLGQLAEHIADDPALATCVVRQLYRYSTGHLEAEQEQPAIEALAEVLADGDFDLVEFMPHWLASAQFRTLAIPQ